MIGKATRQQTKKHNTRLVLKTIYNEQAISRAEIARATHLTPPTVSTIVSTLLKGALIREVGYGLSAGGKRPMMLEVDPASRYILCIDIGHQTFRGALINLRGEIVNRSQVVVHSQAGADKLPLLFDLIDRLQTITTPLLGIGIGSPGLIVPGEGVIREAVNLDWHDLPLKKILKERYDWPIYLANDSKAAALAEFTFGRPINSHNLLLIKTGRGIGAGIVLDGKPFYGDGYGAGEIGQVVTNRSGNKLQTLESLAGTQALLAQARAAGDNDISWADFVTAVCSHTEPYHSIFVNAGQLLGQIVGNLIAAYNIHHIVFAGPLTQLGPLFADVVYQAARSTVLPAMAADSSFSCSSLGDDIVLLGGAALILNEELGII